MIAWTREATSGSSAAHRARTIDPKGVRRLGSVRIYRRGKYAVAQGKIQHRSTVSTYAGDHGGALVDCPGGVYQAPRTLASEPEIWTMARTSAGASLGQLFGASILSHQPRPDARRGPC